MVRIPAFHAGGPGSIPGVGTKGALMSVLVAKRRLIIQLDAVLEGSTVSKVPIIP